MPGIAKLRLAPESCKRGKAWKCDNHCNQNFGIARGSLLYTGVTGGGGVTVKFVHITRRVTQRLNIANLTEWFSQ